MIKAIVFAFALAFIGVAGHAYGKTSEREFAEIKHSHIACRRLEHLIGLTRQKEDDYPNYIGRMIKEKKCIFLRKGEQIEVIEYLSPSPLVVVRKHGLKWYAPDVAFEDDEPEKLEDEFEQQQGEA